MWKCLKLGRETNTPLFLRHFPYFRTTPDTGQGSRPFAMSTSTSPASTASATTSTAPAATRCDFSALLDQFRRDSTSERNKGTRFERLMQLFLLTDPTYANQFKKGKVWLWNEFPSRADLGGKDVGIDLVAQDTLGDYWAIQCKCYAADARIDKAEVDSFLATASRSFTALTDDPGATAKTTKFAHCLWISTTDNWGSNAEEAILNQTPPVSRITPQYLQNSAVDWDKLARNMSGTAARQPAHQAFPHQHDAIAAAKKHFVTDDATRGQLIMACGTGKTFTSLKIAETLASSNPSSSSALVLFLVPSIALLGQTLAEWTAHAARPSKPICICSDPEVSKRKNKEDDTETYSVVDLALPASTNTATILRQLEAAATTPGLTVIFSTYQSIAVIAKARAAYAKKIANPAAATFDLIICDEAHRTTGATLAAEDESEFVKVHDDKFLPARRRLYMTATPRLYHENAKKLASEKDIVLCSMDDPALYGPQFYHISFGDAVNRGLLSDYKVLILTVNERELPDAAQKMVATGNLEIPAADINKLIGCINALSKQIIGDKGITRKTDPAPMSTAVAFCQNIKTSKQITAALNQMGDLYYNTLAPNARENLVTVTADHVDGTMSAPTREQKLTWLKNPTHNTRATTTAAPPPKHPCHILTNVRCLSEGVDVPTLDAVMFLSARNSQVDVVQSVGRVMRRAPNRKYGYIIIPIVTPSEIAGEKALDNNDAYAVVWTVLNALRAHDDRFAATINKIELNKNKPATITIGRAAHGEANATTDATTDLIGKNEHTATLTQMALQFDKMQTLLYAKLVEKVGDRRYWEQWAQDVAKIAAREIETITRLVETSDKHRAAFKKFLRGLQENINPSVNTPAAIEMLAQHRITQPVFEALFENYSFVNNNPVSQSMETMLTLLNKTKLPDDTETLQKFYDSVRQRAKDIDNAAAKQAIILELYDKFFRTAFPKMVERLGIVYTPVEVVDYIIHSVAAVLQKEFDRTLADKNIHILDPFTGTGTFITRLLQSGHIPTAKLDYKYTNEIHANEIVLLAYYIASINIETTRHELTTGKNYIPFNGICLTDTFQLGETQESTDFLDKIFSENSARVRAQKKAPLRIIIGNPPYSIGQKSANDNAQNQDYSKLNQRIEETYAAGSNATLVKGLYDSYIKAFRWSSDRLDPKHGGIICFVSNGSWLDTNGMDSFRRCLEEEFSAIYIFNLRGNQRTSGELSRKEGGKIFGGGSRTPISITLLVKKPDNSKTPKTTKAIIHYRDIGDYLNREEKLTILNTLHDVSNPAMNWQILTPNEHNDWLNLRNDAFANLISLAPDKKFDNKTESVFTLNVVGLVTARDAWVYGFSKEKVTRQIGGMINFYNKQNAAYQDAREKKPNIEVEDFVLSDETKISWTRALRNSVKRDVCLKKGEDFRTGIYRPYCSQHLYFDKNLIEMPGLARKIFPTPDTKNFVICISCQGTNKEMSVLMTDKVPDLHFVGDTQCFPFYWYEDLSERDEMPLFARGGKSQSQKNQYTRRDGISDSILQRARKLHGPKTTKEDIFYYIYALLHNPDYRASFAADLKKMLPRIPLVPDTTAFRKYVEIGHELADLHLHYEDYAHEATEHFGVIQLFSPVSRATIGKSLTTGELDYLKHTVEKMRFGKNPKNAKEPDKSKIIYNDQITLTNIPPEAHAYIVNGKSAIEWIMERYAITTHKESGIVNDPNDWSREHDQPHYILNLLLSVIAISIQTTHLIKTLPPIKFS
jgi:predicted helicase